MYTAFFTNCQSLDEVKKRYKELALKYHPDRGGSTETMQQINAEYQSIIKNPIFNFTSQTEQQQKDFVIYPEIIDLNLTCPYYKALAILYGHIFGIRQIFHIVINNRNSPME